jgi:phthiodiolone/phenolphthiodiolone dimycocerosates ketoreductase
MARFGVGVMHNTINSGFGPKPLVHADYAIGLGAARARPDSASR